jgi:carboxypeptidase C (cathepsin A)
MLRIQRAKGETRARIFLVACALDGPPDQDRRPLTVAFNGGLGSASVWLLVGAISPRRAKLEPDGSMPRLPLRLEEDDYTWLDQIGLVLVDAGKTACSRPTKAEYTGNASPLQACWPGQQ